MLFALAFSVCTASGTHCTLHTIAHNGTAMQCTHAQFTLIANFQAQGMGTHLQAAQCVLQPYGLYLPTHTS